MTQHFDVLVVGAGHNALVCATFLARAGRSVHVLEARDVVGGAARTERPFPKAPDVQASTGAYLVGLVPPELLQELDVELPLLRRDPHYFLPTTDTRYLLFGSDRAASEAQMAAQFSAADCAADRALQAELDALRQDVGPSWMHSPLSIEATAERFVRPALRQVFIDLCRGSVGAYLDRFGFESDLLKAMYAVTDGYTGLDGSWSTPGTGMNFLIHNMCRLPGADGTWMVVEGGMGSVARILADAARRAGASIETNAPVARIELDAGVARRVILEDGRELSATQIVVGADPFRLLDMVGDAAPAELRTRIDGYEREGTTLKLNLCLSDLPRFTCLPEDRGQHRGTIHLLPEEGVVMSALERSYADVCAGKLPEFPAMEWYIHTTLDPSLQDDQGRHSSALFVQWVPRVLAESSWEAEESRYVDHLLSLVDRFAPGASDLVVDTFPLHPQKLEQHFGLTRGHIHHVDNSFGFADRMPYRTPVPGLYACSAGCHPGGSIIGAAGRNAAREMLAD